MHVRLRKGRLPSRNTPDKTFARIAVNLRQAEQTPPFVFAMIGLSVGTVFAVDCVTPLGWAEWVFYLAPVALCQLAAQPNVALFTAAACSLLLFLGYFTSPTSQLNEIAMYNRSFALVVIWCVACLTRQVVASRRRMHKRDWLSSAQAGLSEVVQGEKRVDELAKAVVEFLAGYMDAQIGALYAHDGKGSLKRVGGYALDVEQLEGRTFGMGEGLVGQAAQARRVTLVTQLPGGYARVRSGVGASDPRELLLAPVTADRVLQGVLELGFFRGTGESERELLELLAEPIGIALRTAEYRTRLQELLEETQAQAEELEAQQEELRTNNEELEQQSDVLREQQANLEQQQAELEQTNVQLEEHAQLLVEQKAELMASREQLARKAAELDAASRYKSEFLANMSHELRTPLNSSLILAKLLSDNRDGNLTHEQVKYAQSIYSAGNDLLDLINDVLDLSKIEAGMMEVKPEVVRARAARREPQPDVPAAGARKEPRIRDRARAQRASGPHHRCAAAQADSQEPAVERAQVHRAWSREPYGLVAVGRPGALRRVRHGHRHRARAAPADLRGLPSGRGRGEP